MDGISAQQLAGALIMQVFLSHSSRDKAFVRRLVEDLRQERIQVWLDEIELSVGVDLSTLESNIRRCGSLVVVVSRTSMSSDWVDKEIELARKIGGIRILPVLLDDSPPDPSKEHLWANTIADFRNRSEYRRGMYRLANAILGRTNPIYLSAKQAARHVKLKKSPAGELFGLSHQGVALPYSLANRRDWVYADCMDGASRLWIVEYYDAETGALNNYCVFDQVIHDLPKMYLADTDSTPAANSAVIFSCSLNEQVHSLPQSETEPALPGSQRIDKRYCRSRPVPFARTFIDSDVAVLEAIQHAVRGGAVPESRLEELFVLGKLERDKRQGEALLWKISFFDPTLSESVLTVGIDAVKGHARFPAMQPDTLNANFQHISYDGENLIIDLKQTLKTSQHYICDIPIPGGHSTRPLSARDAIEMSSSRLSEAGWRLAFVSSTGVVKSIVSRRLSAAESLMNREGHAGQWVTEWYHGEPHEITHQGRTWFRYRFRQLLVTRIEGAAEINLDMATVNFTVPFAESPLPGDLFGAFDQARRLAIQTATIEFHKMSVMLGRPKGGAQWHFRFYDQGDVTRRVTISGDGFTVLEVT